MMTRSFLNIVTVDGKLCRIAEFGFHADSPSFDESGIVFRQGEKYKRIDLDTGMISIAEEPMSGSHTSPDGRFTIRAALESELTNGIGYIHLILRDNRKSTETVLTRFMGNQSSLGVMPFSADSVSIAFFGYPEQELGG